MIYHLLFNKKSQFKSNFM